MAVKFETVKSGDVLYDCHRVKMGNTTMTALGVWRVRVVSVDHAARTAVIVWNSCNPEETVSARYFKGLRRAPPEWIREPFKGERCYFCRATKECGHAADCSHPKAGNK